MNASALVLNILDSCNGKRKGELTLSPSNLIETEQNTLLMQRLANQIPSFGRDMVIVLSKDLFHHPSQQMHSLFKEGSRREKYHNQLPLDIPRPLQTIITVALA